MIYSRLIHDYLDIGLDETKEQALFAELAVNPDLRYEFNSQVKLSNIANNDMNIISPPMETTNAIFSTLGFTIPNSSYEPKEDKEPVLVAATAGAGFGVLNFIRENTSSILSAVIAAALTSLLFLLMDTDKDMPDVAQGGNPYDRAALSSNSGAYLGLSKVPVVKSAEMKNSRSGSGFENVQNNANGYGGDISRNDLSALNRFENNYSPSLYNDLHKQLRSGLGSLENGTREEEVMFIPVSRSPYASADESMPAFAPAYSNMMILTYAEPFESDFAVEARSTSSSSDVNTSKVSSFNPNLNLVYAITSEHLVLFGAGMEEFDRLIDKSSLGLPNEMSRKNLVYFNAGYRYSPSWLNIAGFATPFVQVAGGPANGGFIGKGMSGIKFTPENRVYFIVGYEYTYMMHKNEARFLSNNKSGFNIGLGYNF